jgi:hypothetical protein
MSTLPSVNTILAGAGVSSKTLPDGFKPGSLELYESTANGSNKATIKAPASFADYTLTLPANDGSSDQVLTTDGDGVLSWSTVSSSSDFTDTVTISKDQDSEFTALKLKNQSDSSDTTGRVSLEFDLEDASGTEVDAAKIMVVKDQSFTSTGSTQDASMEIWTSLNGTMTKRVIIGAGGELTGAGSGEPSTTFTSTSDCSVRIEGGGGESYVEIANIAGSGDTSNSWGIGCDDDKDLSFGWGTNNTMNKDRSISHRADTSQNDFNLILRETTSTESVKINGKLNVNGPIVTVTDTVAGDGGGTDAISVNTNVTFLTTAGGTSSLTLAAGSDGQVKIITMEVAGNAATLTTSNGNLVSSQVTNSIVWDAVGESATLVYSSTLSKWLVTSILGATIS